MNKRSYFGSFKRSRNQIKLGFILVGAVLLSMAGMIAVLFSKLAVLFSAIESTGGISAADAEAIDQTLQTSLVFFFGIAIVVAFGGLVFGLSISKRIFGPMVAIGRFIDGLIEGQYDQKLRLRDGDDFEEIATKLNELSRRLASAPMPKVSDKQE